MAGPRSEEHKAAMLEGRRLAKERRERAAAEEATRMAARASAPVTELRSPLDALAPDMESEPELMPDIPEEEAAVPPVFAEDDPEPEADPDHVPTPYELFLRSLSAETREVLTDDELRGAFAAAEQAAIEERRAKLRKAVAERAMDQARAAAGLLPAEAIAHRDWLDRMSRKVRWTPYMPFVSDTGGIADEGLRIDGRLIRHGIEIETTYGAYLSMREQIWRLRQHELDFEGKSRLHALRRHIDGNTRFDMAGNRMDIGGVRSL